VLIWLKRAYLPAMAVLLASMAASGCHAQVPATAVQAGVKLSPQMERRIEVMIRNRSDVSPNYRLQMSVPTSSDIAGYDKVVVTFSAEGQKDSTLPIYVSTDGKTLAQLHTFDISTDPRHAVSDAGRPSRGGDEHAPVLIVGFDDLECPFCSRMNAELFPAVLNRYKDQVRIVYRDFPLPEDQHPWAMHAAVDVNCLAAGSPAAYWSYVDYVHSHAAEMGADEKNLAASEKQLDKLAMDEGARQGLDQAKLVACLLKQDTATIKASVEEGEAEPLQVGSTPTLFINGEKVEGILPIETIYDVIDRALIAEGKTPPARPATPAASSPPAQARPGS
jgi:protein-disulfide isomerase